MSRSRHGRGSPHTLHTYLRSSRSSQEEIHSPLPGLPATDMACLPARRVNLGHGLPAWADYGGWKGGYGFGEIPLGILRPAEAGLRGALL
jgi:hypothetical protein